MAGDSKRVLFPVIPGDEGRSPGSITPLLAGLSILTLYLVAARNFPFPFFRLDPAHHARPNFPQ